VPQKIVFCFWLFAVPLSPRVLAEVPAATDSGAPASANSVKTELEKWLIDLKNSDAAYRRTATKTVSAAPRVKASAAPSAALAPAKPNRYQVEPFARQYTPAEDDGRKITLLGTVTQIVGKKDLFRIILNDLVAYSYASSQTPKAFDAGGNARVIGPYAIGQDVTVSGRCLGKDDDGFILIAPR
jgi:hypothetical protein